MLNTGDIVTAAKLLTEDGVKVKLDDQEYIKIALMIIAAVTLSMLGAALVKSLFK